MSFDPAFFARNVAARRVHLGLKPKQLASRMGVDPATIYRIERGDRVTIEQPQLEALAKALGCSPEDLLAGEWLSEPRGHEQSEDRLARIERSLERLADRLGVGELAELRDAIERHEDEHRARWAAQDEQLRQIMARLDVVASPRG